MKAQIPTDDELHDLMRRAVGAAPSTPSFDEMLARAATHGVVAGPEYLVPATPTGAGTRRRRSARTMIVSVLVALGLTGGGYLAYATYLGPDGYDTPTEAVDAFVDAASSGDLLRASRALVPFERDHMAERFRAMLDLATENGLLAHNDVANARHITLRPSGLKWSEHEMAAGYIRVEADAGSIAVTYDGTLLGPFLNTKLGPQKIDLVQKLRPQSGAGAPSRPAGFVAVRHDGEWYVSLTYTALETLRIANARPMPAFATRVEARGAETPEAAATDGLLGFYGASADGGRRLLPVIDPVAGEAFQRYLSTLFNSGDPINADLGVRNLHWSVTGSGQWRVARLESYDASDDPSTTSTDDTASVGQSLLFGPLTVALVERDGRWFVDPIESLGRLLPTVFHLRGPGSARAGATEPAAPPTTESTPTTTPSTPSSPTTIVTPAGN